MRNDGTLYQGTYQSAFLYSFLLLGRFRGMLQLLPLVGILICITTLKLKHTTNYINHAVNNQHITIQLISIEFPENMSRDDLPVTTIFLTYDSKIEH